MSKSADNTSTGIPAEDLRRVLQAAEHLYRSGSFLVPDDPTDPWDEWSIELLAVHGDNESVLALRRELERLPLEERLRLVALMWLGRGDYDPGAWSEAQRAAEAVSDGYVTEYLVATAGLATLLRRGASKLGLRQLH